MSKEPLCIIFTHFNPCNYVRPAYNLARFRRMLHEYDAPYAMAHLAFDDQANDLNSIVVPRDRCTLWQKEALLNTLIDHLADSYEAIAWIDADILFMRDGWLEATRRELDHFPVVQMFSQAHLLDRDDEIASTVRSVGWHYSTGHECWRDFSVSHPGFAWAARSELLKKNKLYPYMITGCGDSAMLRGFTLDKSPGFDESIGKPMARHLARWAADWQIDVKGEMGFVMGSVVHMWHGDLRDRQNSERRYWMREVDPDTDLEILENGAVSWTEHALKNKQRLVRGVAEYFTTRREDG